MSAVRSERYAWVDAVWGSELKPLERLVALAYARYAGKGTQCVWVALPTLMADTGLSRDAANRALRGLVTKGWLVRVEKARQHRSARYNLVLPSSTADGRLADVDNSSSSTPRDIQPSASRTRSSNGTGLTTSQSPTSPQGAHARAADPLDRLDLALLRAKVDLDGISDTTVRTVASRVLNAARNEVRDVTRFVVASFGPDRVKEAVELEWQSVRVGGDDQW